VKLNLKFSSLECKDFIDTVTLDCDLERLVQHIKNKSCNQTLSNSSLIEGMTKAMPETNDFWHIICGHHFVCILSFAFRKTVGSQPADKVDPDGLELALRLAYSFNDFAKTRLFASIYQWQQAHTPYRIFRDPV